MSLSKIITGWYSKNKRALPWRQTSDPYLIWLSEIILQQTRVDQGLPYYLKFAETYPCVKDLAAAPEQNVLRLWQGLGYYSRARNLHATAKIVTEKYKGEFPRSYSELIQLKGIGDYTASAISSFCFREPKAVLDGNVIRVLSRYFGVRSDVSKPGTIKALKSIAQEVLDPEDPGTHNQAMMEFGARQCVPVNPDCGNCVLRSSCTAWSKKLVGKLPHKRKKNAVRQRFFHYLLIRKNGKILLRQRKEKDIWRFLYDLPCIESEKRISPGSLTKAIRKTYPEFGKEIIIRKSHAEVRHVLSHQLIRASFFEISTSGKLKLPDSTRLVPGSKLEDYPLPRLIDRFISGR